MFRADRGGLASYSPYPCREPRGDNPHPRPNRSRWNSIPPLSASPWPRRRPVLVFPGSLLGLGGISRHFGRRNGSGGKGNGSPYQAQRRILWLYVSAGSNGRMARTMRKKTWTVIAVANDTRHLWSCLQKATDAHDAMRQCVAEMGALDPLNFQIIRAIRGNHDVIASGEDGGPRSGPQMTALCWCAGSWTASGTAILPFTSGCHVVFWRTGCVGCGPN